MDQVLICMVVVSGAIACVGIIADAFVKVAKIESEVEREKLYQERKG